MNAFALQGPSRARTAASVAVLALLFAWVFPYFPQVNNPNENVRIYMTVAIVDDHTFAINRIEQAWGYTNDKAVRDGRLYSSKAPGTSYLGVPVYWLLTKITHRSTLPPALALPHTLSLVLPGHRARPPPPRPLPPIDRTVVVYVLRLFTNVVPALLFAWFWHRFLGQRTRSPALREAVFFSTMAGSSLFAYSEVFASHAHNAFCTGAAIMAVAAVREGDRAARRDGAEPGVDRGRMALAGLFGAGATMFEYPAALASASVALWILATAAERRRGLLLLAALSGALAGALALRHHRPAAAVAALTAAMAYGATLSWRSLQRLVFAGLGGAIPAGLVLLYHARCFGDPFKPGYSFLENPQFRAETNQGFFGATAFSWEAALRMWLDPAFGLVPLTPIFLVSVVGFASYLAWRPEETPLGRLARGWLVRGPLALVAVAALVGAALSVHGNPADLTRPETGRWFAVLVAALLGLFTTVTPRPLRDDASMGAVMLLVAVPMTHLIGMMNNWRGGWQVGPRYLVTLVPILGITALAGLEAIASAGGPFRRLATVFAGGATVVAVLITGIPSAFFPHIPTEYGSPFFELFLPLVRGGFVPHNAGHLMGLAGAASMFGFALALFAVAVIAARGDERRPVSVAAHALGTAAVVAALLIPFAAAVRPETAPVTRYVRSVWEPRPPAEVHADAAVPARETPAAARARGRAMAEAGDGRGALEAYLRAVRGSP